MRISGCNPPKDYDQEREFPRNGKRNNRVKCAPQSGLHRLMATDRNAGIMAVENIAKSLPGRLFGAEKRGNPKKSRKTKKINKSVILG